jgi:MinD superfamily P-loop ATPase
MEGEMVEKVVHIEEELCNACETCVLMCSKEILYINKEGTCDVLDHSLCDRLKGCEMACPEGTIKIR